MVKLIHFTLKTFLHKRQASLQKGTRPLTMVSKVDYRTVSFFFIDTTLPAVVKVVRGQIPIQRKHDVSLNCCRVKINVSSTKQLSLNFLSLGLLYRIKSRDVYLGLYRDGRKRGGIEKTQVIVCRVFFSIYVCDITYFWVPITRESLRNVINSILDEEKTLSYLCCPN